MNNFKQIAKTICVNAKSATKIMAKLDVKTKNKILSDAILLIKSKKNDILLANKKDIEFAQKNHLDSAKIDRLLIDETKIDSMIKSIEDIINLPDPVGKISLDVYRPSGLNIKRISTPIGVLLAIYEARPNVSVDISSMAIKSGNVAILRSGIEAFNSSKILVEIFQTALESNGINKFAINFCDNIDRKLISQLLKFDKFIDVVVPRGGKSLIQAISKNTKIPLFKHLDGNCHTYIHQDANFEKARKILINAKMRRVGICGATESLLVDKKIARQIIPLIMDDMQNLGCEVRGDKLSVKIDNRIILAKKSDYYCEYLDKVLSLKIVKNVDEAIEHISKFGSSHTESIVTEDKKSAQKFLQEIDSAIVMHNSSTQFADGGEFGFGGEVGIATGKLHARGPVGLEQLTIFKYIVEADFAIRK